MYNQPYFIPGYYSSMAAPSMMRGAMGMGGSMLRAGSGIGGASRGLSLMSKLGNGFSALSSFNWGGFINNASKTLGVINQTIPLVKQVGPMVNNVKSMLRVASIFKDETDKPTRTRRSTSSSSSMNQASQPSSKTNTNTNPSTPVARSSNVSKENTPNTTEVNKPRIAEDNSPTFFISSLN